MRLTYRNRTLISTVIILAAGAAKTYDLRIYDLRIYDFGFINKE